MKRIVHSYLIGTEVQDKSGRIKKKVGDLDGTKWISRGRYVFMNHFKQDLTENHRVFHMNGDIADDDPKNLVAIKFSGVRYALKTSRVVYEPPKPKNIKAYIPKREGALASV